MFKIRNTLTSRRKKSAQENNERQQPIKRSNEPLRSSQINAGNRVNQQHFSGNLARRVGLLQATELDANDMDEPLEDAQIHHSQEQTRIP